MSAVERDISDGNLLPVDLLWRRTMDRAVALSRAHTPPLGTRKLDVPHVAAALTLGMSTFVTYDARQGRLAKVAGLRVLQP
jgi:hypothetical protein